MFSKYYHEELTYLRESGRLFAEKNPNTRSLLDERGSDPSVERLFQAQAFLAARFRVRVDNAPEAYHDICAAVAPQHLRSVPASSIIEVTPEVSSLRGRGRLDSGTKVVAKAVEGTACRFRTTAPLDLLPIRIAKVHLDGPRTSAPVLRLEFSALGATTSGVFQPEGIRLFLHGDFAVTTTLWLSLLRHCRGVKVRRLGGEGPAVELGSEVVVPAAFERELALLPWPSDALQGARLLQEYYALPQKFLFLDIRGLDAAQAAAGPSFEIAFNLVKPLELPGPIDQGAFRVNCVPVINLFTASAERIAFERVGQEHLLRPEGLPEGHAEVFSVDAVQGKEREGAARQVYLPIACRQPAARPAMRAHYRVRRELSVLGDAVDTYLSLGLGHHAPAIPEDETLSVDLTCTNASLPGRLRVGDISEEVATIQARYRNLVPVTAPMLPRLRSDVCWDLVCQRSLGMRAFDTIKGLIGTLTVYDFTARTDDESQHSNRRCIQSIRVAETRPVRRLLDDIPTLGAHTEVEVEEAAFASQGEAFLFGCVLQELFASYLTMNSFTELKLRLLPSGAEFSWAPKQGQLPLV